MKKTLVILTFFAFLSSYAQKINFGIKAGLNLSTLTADADKIMSSSTGFHAGAFVEFKALGKIAVQPELLFSAQGAKFEGKDVSSVLESTQKMDYVVVPVMLKYYVLSVGGLFLEAGPQVGFLVSAKNEVQNKLTNVSTTEDIKDATKGLDTSVNFGVGYDILDKIVVQTRYSLGLTNVSEADEVTSKNGVFQLSLGYKF